MKNEKILICVGTDDKFVMPIADHLGIDNEVQVFRGGTVQDLFELMKWCDVAWFEWCNDMIVQASRLPKVCKMVCRLHRYEAYSDLPNKVQWDYVDNLILVSDSMLELVKARFPNISCEINVIGNPLHIPEVDNHPKSNTDIACVGYLNSRKNIGLALQIMSALPKCYTLHVAGSWQDPMLLDYTEYMIKEMDINVLFYGFLDNISGFLEDKGVLLSTSQHESFGYHIFEAMARNIKPVVHNFLGAKQLYPEHCLYNTVAEAVDKITATDDYDYRLHVEGNDQAKIMKNIEEIL